MRILGIETSCDETACAIVEDGRRVLTNVIASQHDLHAEYAGVVPEIASRAHVERFLPVLRTALDEATMSLNDLDAIAVGNRPGLIGSLLVGVAAAKALAWSLEKPLIGIDHIHAHLFAPLLEQDADLNDVYPALGLVVSGGHTAIYLCKSPLDLNRLGSTIDDAVGEAYDKVGSILGLEHPGGPKLDKLAQTGNDRAFDLPISRLAKDSLDFSYSGLKTAVLYAVRGFPKQDPPPPPLDDVRRADMAASFQRAAIGAIMFKLARAIDQLDARGDEINSILIGGGVSANSRLRADLTTFAKERSLTLRMPSLDHCLDNAAMIAGLAHHKLTAGQLDDLTLQAIPTAKC